MCAITMVIDYNRTLCTLHAEDDKCASAYGSMEFLAEELFNATSSYGKANLIGEGGYGRVYRGTLRHTTVAIKVLSEVNKMFKTTVEPRNKTTPEIRPPQN